MIFNLLGKLTITDISILLCDHDSLTCQYIMHICRGAIKGGRVRMITRGLGSQGPSKILHGNMKGEWIIWGNVYGPVIYYLTIWNYKNKLCCFCPLFFCQINQDICQITPLWETLNGSVLPRTQVSQEWWKIVDHLSWSLLRAVTWHSLHNVKLKTQKSDSTF